MRRAKSMVIWITTMKPNKFFHRFNEFWISFKLVHHFFQFFHRWFFPFHVTGGDLRLYKVC